MIIYAVVANVSVTGMFTAGIIPGLLVGFVLILSSWWICKQKGFVGTSKVSSTLVFELDFNSSSDQYFTFDNNSSNFEIPTNRFQINLRYKLN